MNVRTHQDVLTGLWTAELQDKRYPNVYGQGSSEREANISLRIRLHQINRKKEFPHG
jgi:hypothetical protein